MSTTSVKRGVSEETLTSLSTPDRVETRLGTLEFRDGAPSAETERPSTMLRW